MFPARKPSTSPRNPHGIMGDFLIISLQKFRRNKEEFSMWIFPPLFPRESLPHTSLIISKCHKRPYKGSQLSKSIPVMFNCKFFGELKG